MFASCQDQAFATAPQHLLRSKPCVILVASATVPAGPEDVVGRAMIKVGGSEERFPATEMRQHFAHCPRRPLE